MKVFITGVSSGIGRALTIRLIKAGHEVWGIARRRKALEELKEELGSENLYLSVCNVGNLAEMQVVVNKMKDSDFIPDAIVLNAAMNPQDSAETLDFRLYQKAFDVNLRGAMFWVVEFLPDFLRRNSGQFVAICSTSAFRRGYGGIAYSASKAALALTFRRLRMRFADKKIKFSTLYFGPINTEFWRGPNVWFLVPSANRAARFITKILKKNSGEYYFPFVTTMLSRLSFLVPEFLFVFLSKHLKIYGK